MDRASIGRLEICGGPRTQTGAKKVARHVLFERAIRSARDASLIEVAAPEAKARELFAYLEGTLTQARIQDDPALLDGMAAHTVEILSAGSRTAAGLVR